MIKALPECDQTVTLQWYCGRAIGTPYWQMQGDWVFDCDECCNEFKTTHTQEEIDKEMISVTCPDCGAELTMDMDEPEIIKELNDETHRQS